MVMNVNVHRHNYWLQCYDCDAPSRIRGMRSKRETDFHRLLVTATSTRRTVRGTRSTLTFHSTGLVSYQSHDTISRWGTANNDHILFVIHLHSRNFSVKKKKKTFHNNTLCPALQEVTIKTKYLLNPRGRVLLEKLTVCSRSRNCQHFMETKGSLPHSQVPDTCPYSEPARSSPYPNIPLPEDPFNFILPSTPGSPKWSLSLRLSPKTPYTPLLSSIRAICPAHLILLDFITRTILGEDQN